MEGDILSAKIKVDNIRYYNDDKNWGIISFTVLELLKGNQIPSIMKKGIAKGPMVQPIRDAEYILEAKEVTDKKFGRQYDIHRMCKNISIEADDVGGKRKYLETLYTKNQIHNMYETLADPYEFLLNKDVAALTKVKGCGFKTARLWIDKFNKDFDNARIFSELYEYNFSSAMAIMLLDQYKTADLVIKKVKTSPYDLIEISGIGWKKCDEIAKIGGLRENSPERVEAFIKYYLKMMAEEGNTYVDANRQLMQAILDNLGEDIPDEPITKAIHRLDDKLVWSSDHAYVGLKRYFTLESRIAKKLIELRDSPNTFKYDNWKRIVELKEIEQGWTYTEQQIEGIKATLENQVVIITGYGGTGKSSIVAGMMAVLGKYKFAQCALSGRAAARLAESTGIEGYTIHRLLKYPSKDSDHQMFFYNEDNPLDYDVVIVDEISMVSAEIFWYLIRSLRPGTKLVLLGDVGQLESIGCGNIANDLIESSSIKSVVLDKIHRQAAASAIITDSIEARNGVQVIEKDFAGKLTKGELQDLTYDCYSDGNNTFYKIMEYASYLHEKNIPVNDIQIIVPTKETQSGTWNLNLALQEIFNPLDDKEQLIVQYEGEKVSAFRVGDKVINIKNNYSSRTYDGQWEETEKDIAEEMGEHCPIFNGSMGLVTAINKERNELIVDFTGIGKVLIKSDMLKSMMLGYAVTVHKCQGSEFPYVIFGIDFTSYSLLTRQLIYTAITRASKHCYVVAQTRALRYAIIQNSVSKKQTILKDVLYEIDHPKF